MQALLLAAGKSRRFQPLGDKNFFRIGESFLIEKSVTNLKKAGINKITFVANSENEKQIQDVFPRSRVVIQKNLAEGMAGAVLAARKFLDEPTLIASTNDLVEPTIIRKALTAKNCDGALLAQKVTSYFPGGYLEIKNGLIRNIVEKPAPEKAPSSLVNLVFHFFREPKFLLSELKKTSKARDDKYERALARLFEKQKFVAVINSGKWRVVKFPWHALDLITDFSESLKKNISPMVKIAKNTIVENSIVSKGARILDFAVVKNSFIGKNAVVGNFSLVRNSQILENSVVGSGSEIARSSLGVNSRLHRNYVGDSILAKNVSLGAGAVCANLRLDEAEIFTKTNNKKVGSTRNKLGAIVGANSRIGVNSSLMPGISIGENCFIGSGIVVAENLKSRSFLDSKWKTKLHVNQKSVVLHKKVKKVF